VNADRFQEASRIFLEARRLGLAGRDEWLDQACRGDPDLRACVEALLVAEHRPLPFASLAEDLRCVQDQVLDDLAQKSIPAGQVSTWRGSDEPASEALSRIGPYKLLQKIGEGGFGTVYMAEQIEPVRRKVAVKILKPGMDTRQVIARFEAERQALAMMDHPNITRVLDAGATPTGRPFFVMELVNGIPITEYCDKQHLCTGDRIALFLPVCRAVQHAHQKGIIHRDLKPANILITLHDGKPVPKVIDFGIAKALSGRLTDKTLFTEFRQLLGTPMYMSPEQAEMSGLDVDTRADIYSLGVCLYEILTGLPPYDGKALRSAGFGEIQRILREVEPPTPSSRYATLIQSAGAASTSADPPETPTPAEIARHRCSEPAALARELKGEVDWIVMKCLEKDRTRRYESVGGLCEDLERYLRDEPVSAGPPSTFYRLGKFARRHRGLIGATAAVFLSLVAGLAFAAWGLVRAHEEMEDAKAARRLERGEVELEGPGADRGGDVRVQEVVGEGDGRRDRGVRPGDEAGRGRKRAGREEHPRRRDRAGGLGRGLGAHVERPGEEVGLSLDAREPRQRHVDIGLDAAGQPSDLVLRRQHRAEARLDRGLGGEGDPRGDRGERPVPDGGRETREEAAGDGERAERLEARARDGSLGVGVRRDVDASGGDRDRGVPRERRAGEMEDRVAAEREPDQGPREVNGDIGVAEGGGDVHGSRDRVDLGLDRRRGHGEARDGDGGAQAGKPEQPGEVDVGDRPRGVQGQRQVEVPDLRREARVETAEQRAPHAEIHPAGN
jgi:serine/threonine protein kinase